MQIKSLDVFRLQIPLNIRFSQSNNSTSISDSCIIKIITNNHLIAYGECCPRTYVTGEDHLSVKKDFETHLDLLLYQKFENITDIQTFVTETLPPLMGLSSICALELALLDAFSKTQQQSLPQLLNIQLPKRVEYSGVIPISSPEKLIPLSKKFKVFQFKDIKIKIGTNLQQSIDSLNIIKEHFKHAQNFRADANCAWSEEDIHQLTPTLIQNGISTIEQAFPKGQKDNMVLLTKAFGQDCEIMADESLTSYKSAIALVESSACNRFNIKLSKTGGIFNALKIYELAEQHNISCQLGAHFGETSILTAAGILFSALAPNLKTHEGAMGELLLKEDFAYPSIILDLEAEVKKIEEMFTPCGLGQFKYREDLLTNL